MDKQYNNMVSDDDIAAVIKNMPETIEGCNNPAIYTANVIHAVLFASGEPVSKSLFLHKLNIPSIAFEVGIIELKKMLEREGGAIILREIDDKYQLLTNPAYGDIVRVALSQKRARMSQEALETLTLIAYRQPVTKSEIESVRGVNCDSTVSYLENQGFIKRLSRIDSPGAPFIYETTDKFLIQFGLSSLADLPPMDTGQQD